MTSLFVMLPCLCFLKKLSASERLLNSLLVGELGDGAERRQSLLQRDDLKRQVTGRQDEDAHSEKTHPTSHCQRTLHRREDVKMLTNN